MKSISVLSSISFWFYISINSKSMNFTLLSTGVPKKPTTPTINPKTGLPFTEDEFDKNPFKNTGTVQYVIFLFFFIVFLKKLFYFILFYCFLFLSFFFMCLSNFYCLWFFSNFPIPFLIFFRLVAKYVLTIFWKKIISKVFFCN